MDGTRAPQARPAGHRPQTGAVVGAPVRRLASLFVAEPELVRAWLQDVGREASERTQLVLAAARVAAEQCPGYADLLRYAAEAALAAGAFDEAAELAERALLLNPGYRDGLALAGRIALLRGRPAQAADLLQRAVDAGAAWPDVHVLLGDAWREQADWTRARAAYARACALNPRLDAARAALAALPAAGVNRSGAKP